MHCIECRILLKTQACHRDGAADFGNHYIQKSPHSQCKFQLHGKTKNYFIRDDYKSYHIGIKRVAGAKRIERGAKRVMLKTSG